MGQASGEADSTRAIGKAVRPYWRPLIAAIQGCSWIMATCRDGDPKGLTSVSAITLQMQAFTSVGEIREYTTTVEVL